MSYVRRIILIIQEGTKFWTSTDCNKFNAPSPVFPTMKRIRLYYKIIMGLYLGSKEDEITALGCGMLYMVKGVEKFAILIHFVYLLAGSIYIDSRVMCKSS